MYCRVKTPFSIIKELKKADVDITDNIHQPSKYEELKDRPVQAFLFLNRNVYHHCTEWRIELHEIINIYMSKKTIIRNLIPKILRWADSSLDQYKHSIGEKMDLLRTNFSKEPITITKPKTILIKHHSFEKFGARALEFHGSSMNDFERFLKSAVKLAEDAEFSYHGQFNESLVGIYDLNDIRDGMTVVLEFQSAQKDSSAHAQKDSTPENNQITIADE
jgi:hypothetical protein